MRIILNEKEILDRSLNEGYINLDKPSSTFGILAKHFFSIGQNKEQVVDSIDSFMSKNMNGYKFIKWRKAIRRSVNWVLKKRDFTLNDVRNITIYQNEVNKINSIGNLRLEKLAFVYLVYSKIYNEINKNDKYWVNAEWRDIFSDAKIYASFDEKGKMINKLVNMDLLSTSTYVKCSNAQVNFANKEVGKVAFVIDDFKDFIYYYLKYIGENVGRCEKCNSLIVLTSNRKIYCRDCWREKEQERQREKWHKYKDN